MPELPPPPSLDGVGPRPPIEERVRALVAEARARAGVLAGGLAVTVVVAVVWLAFLRGGAGEGPPPELTMPRAGVAVPSTSSASSSSSSSTLASGDPSPPGGAGVLVVHVAGAVASPGLYRLGGSPRVADAVDAAGGAAPDADLDAMNLAAPVADGERIYVPRQGEAPPDVASATDGSSPTPGPVDLNTATTEQLDALPGVGPSTAQAIIDYRREHGRFRSVDELLEVRGIGQAKLDGLRDLVRVR